MIYFSEPSVWSDETVNNKKCIICSVKDCLVCEED